MTGGESPTDSTDSDPDPYDRFREHRRALEAIGAGSDPDAHAARIILARLDGREPDPDDLAKLSQGDDHFGRATALHMTTPRKQFRHAAQRLLRRIEEQEHEDGPGGV